MQQKQSRDRYRVALPSGKVKHVTPESHFLRTGRVSPGFDYEKAKKLGERYLSRMWLGASRRSKIPAPGFRERLVGKRLSLREQLHARKQMEFALKVFCRNTGVIKRQSVRFAVHKALSNRHLSLRFKLTEKGKDPTLLYSNIADSKADFIERGRLSHGIYKPKEEKFAVSEDWLHHGPTTPIHETIHLLAEKKVIRVDVPFATAADVLYGVEHEMISPQLNSTLTKREFDFQETVKSKSEHYYDENDESYEVGDKLGHWIYANIPEKKRWDYLYWRCMGKSHLRALRICHLK